jgi:hypothetical protein
MHSLPRPCTSGSGPQSSGCVEKLRRARDIREMDPTLERMADALVASGDYRVIRRLEPQAEYHPPDDNPKLVAAVVDVETTGTDPEHDKIIELGICLFEYGRSDGRIYRVIGSWDWLEDPGISRGNDAPPHAEDQPGAKRQQRPRHEKQAPRNMGGKSRL